MLIAETVSEIRELLPRCLWHVQQIVTSAELKWLMGAPLAIGPATRIAIANCASSARVVSVSATASRRTQTHRFAQVSSRQTAVMLAFVRAARFLLWGAPPDRHSAPRSTMYARRAEKIHVILAIARATWTTPASYARFSLRDAGFCLGTHRRPLKPISRTHAWAKRSWEGGCHIGHSSNGKR